MLVMMLFVLLGQLLPALRPVAPDPDFAAIRTFRCEFGDGEGRDYTKRPAANRRGDNLGEMIFDAVNYASRTARIIGNAGSSDVQLFDGRLAVTFLERTDVGGTILTTIFKEPSGLAQYPAAVSRHIAYTFDGHAVTQYYGTCRALL